MDLGYLFDVLHILLQKVHQLEQRTFSLKGIVLVLKITSRRLEISRIQAFRIIVLVDSSGYSQLRNTSFVQWHTATIQTLNIFITVQFGLFTMCCRFHNFLEFCQMVERQCYNNKFLSLFPFFPESFEQMTAIELIGAEVLNNGVVL